MNLNWLSGIKNFLLKSERVWRVTKKPSTDEFKIVVKVSAIGILIIGLIGFIVQMVWSILG